MLVAGCCLQKGLSGIRARASAWELRGARPRAKRLCHGVTSLEKPIPTHLSWEKVVPTCCPSRRCLWRGKKGGLPSACCFLLSPRVLAFGEARSSSSMAMICPRLGCAWSFWVSLMLGDIPKPLGQICSLSERGSKPATSYAGWAKVVSGKLFPPSAEFFSLQKRT